MEGHELGHHGAEQPPTGLLVTGDAHGREPAQRERDGQLADHRVGPDEPAKGDRGDGFELVDRAGLRGHEPGRQPLVAPADPDVAEVGVARSALPHAPGAGHRPQRLGVGVGPLQPRPLLVPGLAGPLAHLAEVAQVVLAVLVHLGLALTATAATTAGDHAHHGHHHHRREQQRRRVPRATVGEQQAHHPEHCHDHDHRHDLHDDARGDDARDLRWRLEVDLAPGRARRGQARGALVLDGAHRCDPPLTGVDPWGRSRSGPPAPIT